MRLLVTLHNLLLDSVVASAAVPTPTGAEDDGYIAAAAAAVAAAPTESDAERAARRAARFEVLVLLVRFAGASAQTPGLHGSILDDTPSAAEVWRLSLAERRRLHLVVARLHDSAADELGAQRELVRYLSTFAAGDAKELAALEPLASRAALGAARASVSGAASGVGLGIGALDGVGLGSGVFGLAAAPPLAPDALLRLPALAALASAGAEPKANHELLTLFASGLLPAFREFASAKGDAFFAARKLDRSACEAKMRMLSLCSLVCDREEVTYAEVAAALSIEVDDVELWVVRCTSARLLDARMDQLRQVLVVSRCVNRGFSGDAQWKALQAKLGAWKTNVRAMIGALAKQRSAGAQLAPP